jgi:putative oxidoreductase
MNLLRNDDLGKLIVRVTVGGLMLTHGIGKVTGGIQPIVEMVRSKGMPGAFAYGVYVGEVVAPILIIIGLLTRPAAAVLAFNMVVAVALAHPGDIFKLGEHGEWKLELHAFYFFCAVAVMIMGSGKYGVSKGRGRWD